MSVRKHMDGTYFYRFMRKGKDYSEFGFPTEQMARDVEAKTFVAAREREANPEAVEARASQSITLRDLCEWYNRVFAISNASERLDRAHGSVVCDYFKNRTHASLTVEDILTFRAWLAKQKIGRGGFTPSQETLNHYTRYIRKVINKAINFYRTEEGGKPVSYNPAAFVKEFEVPRKKPRFLSEDKEAILSRYIAVNLPALLPYYLVGLHTGIRQESLTELRVNDLSFDESTIFISDAKGHSSYHVPMDDFIQVYLKQLVRGKGGEMRALGSFHPNTVGRMFTKAARACQIVGVTFHSLRHTFAERLLRGGTNPYTVSDYLHHSSFDVTQKVYGHLDKSARNSSIKALDESYASHRVLLQQICNKEDVTGNEKR